MKRIVDGESYKEIGYALGISVGTVAAHASRAYAKIGRQPRVIKLPLVLDRSLAQDSRRGAS